jgi:thiamine-monophosphate kinase
MGAGDDVTHSGCTVGDLGERALVARIAQRLESPSWALVGPGDDAAVVAIPKRTFAVLTTDALVEGVHFDRRFCPPSAIGHKAMAVNLSDLAAMGATPHSALLSLVLPDALTVAELDAIVEGAIDVARRYRAAIVGGNITRSWSTHDGIGRGPLVIDITAVGSVAPRRVLTRAGARPGDEVYVTGSIGLGAVGLHMLAGATTLTAAPTAIERYLRPEPRVRMGMLLGRNRAATACVDLSDGLADGVRRLAGASRVGVTIDVDALPVDESVRRWHEAQAADPVEAVMAGGDDYELLFTVRPTHRGRLKSLLHQRGDLAVTKIGMVTKDVRLVLRTASGDRTLPEGFEHFR